MLQFGANQAVVPARIAAVNEDSLRANVWRVITVAAEQLRLQAGGFNSELLFSGTHSNQDLANFPAVASLGSAGKGVTKMDIYFPGGGVEEDILLEQNPQQQDYRHTVVVYEDCGCAAAASSFLPVIITLGLVMQGFAFLRRRRRRT